MLFGDFKWFVHVNNRVMDFFNFTKLLNTKINAYDKVAKNPFIASNLSNPFLQPINITVVWVEEDTNNDELS